MNIQDLMILSSPMMPVTMPEVIKTAKTANWISRRMFFFHPWPRKEQNVVMWIYIGLLISLISWLIYTSNIHHMSFLFNLGIGYLCIETLYSVYSFGVTTGLTLRLAIQKQQDQQEMMKQLQAVADSYSARIVEQLKEMTGREHINVDPISLAAATLEATDTKTKSNKPSSNILRDLLEGKLNPQDFLAPPDSDEDDVSFND